MSSFFDKAKAMAEDLVDKAGPLADKARPLAEKARPLAEKAAPYAEKAGDLAAKGVSEAAKNLNRATGGKYQDRIDNVSNKLGGVLGHDKGGEEAPGTKES